MYPTQHISSYNNNGYPFINNIPTVFIPQKMNAKLFITNNEKKTKKELLIHSFPYIISNNRNIPNINIQLPKFNGTIIITQQNEKLIVQTSNQSTLQINQNIMINTNDWCQLRSGDYLQSNIWTIQIEFYLDNKFKEERKIINTNQIRIDDTENGNNKDIITSDNDNPTDNLPELPFIEKISDNINPKDIVKNQSVTEFKHPIFNSPNEEGFDIDKYLDKSPSKEPNLINEMEKLSIPSSNKTKITKPRKPKTNKQPKKQRRNSLPNKTKQENISILLKYPGKEHGNIEKVHLYLDKDYQLKNILNKSKTIINTNINEQENEQENNNSVNIQSPPKPKKIYKPKKSINKPTNRRKKSISKQKLSTPPKVKQPVKRNTSRRTSRFSCITPGRTNPSRHAKGKKLSEEEISRLSKQSNDELRRLIGEKKHLD